MMLLFRYIDMTDFCFFKYILHKFYIVFSLFIVLKLENSHANLIFVLCAQTSKSFFKWWCSFKNKPYTVMIHMKKCYFTLLIILQGKFYYWSFRKSKHIIYIYTIVTISMTTKSYDPTVFISLGLLSKLFCCLL